MAILVITNGNGSLFQNAFGDSDSIEDSVDEIVESAEEERDDVRDEAEEAREDTDSGDEVRDRDNEEGEDDDETNSRDDDGDDAAVDLDSNIENEVREIRDNIIGCDACDAPESPPDGSGSSDGNNRDETSLLNRFASDPGEDGEDGRAGPTGIGKDESDVPSGLVEGSGMEIWPKGASPDEIAELIAALIQDTGAITEDTVAAIGAAGVVADGQSELILDSLANRVGASPGNVPTLPRDLTFDEDFNNLSTGIIDCIQEEGGLRCDEDDITNGLRGTITGLGSPGGTDPFSDWDLPIVPLP